MIRHMVLLGVGPGHFRFLQGLLKNRSTDLAITLITRQERYIDTARLLHAVAGLVPMEGCGAELEPLLRKVNVNWLDHTLQAIKPDAKVVVLDDGRELRFDWLSLEPESAQNRELLEQQMPGARANGLFLRPREVFCKLWPRVAALAAQTPQRFAVVGGATPNLATVAMGSGSAPESQAGAGLDWPQEKFAIELAFAVRRAFKGSAVTLITGDHSVAAQASPALRARILGALRRQRITVLADAAVSIQAGEISLRSGATLACDAPLLAQHMQLPAIFTSSGLALDKAGEIETDSAQCSVSHPHVFAAGAALDARDSSRVLAASLQAVMAGKQPAGFRRRKSVALPVPFQLLRCSGRHLIVAWRQWALTIRWPGSGSS